MPFFTLAISPQSLIAFENISYQKTGMSTYEIENDTDFKRPVETEKKEKPHDYSTESPYGDVYDPNNPYAEWEN